MIKISFPLVGLTFLGNFNTFAISDVPITFARGKSVKAIKARISAGGRRCYFLNTSKGTTFEATVNAANTKVVIFESGEASYIETARINGRYSVCVDNLGGSTSYDLVVKLTPPQ